MAGKQAKTVKAVKSSKPTRATEAGKKVSGQTRAGLIVAPSRCNRLLRSGRYSDRIGASAGVFLAGVIEYLTREILEISGDQAEQAKKYTIKPSHIQQAIRNDEELTKLFATIQVSEGGFKREINEFLLKGKGKGKKGAQDAKATQEV